MAHNLGLVARHTTTINICFHGVGTPERDLEPGEDAYWITEDCYREIVEEIATWPSVGISFDDGNASDASIALEPLVQRGLQATFFVLAGRIDKPGSLATAQIHELSSAGMGIGSHGMDHVPWTSLDDRSRGRELVEAREILSTVVDRRISHAACPLGRYDRSVLAELRRLGYARVHTSDRVGARRSAWIQPRYSIRRDDTAESIRTAILGRQGLRHRVRPVVTSAVKRLR